MGGVTMPRTSVDPVASLDEMKGHGWEPSEQAPKYEDPEPELKVSCVDTMRLLQEINRAKPKALNLLLDSAVDKMTSKEISRHLKITVQYAEMLRHWLRLHHPSIAACLTNAPLRPR
jgi:hypothetical protein